jgi:hypothetical protein
MQECFPKNIVRVIDGQGDNLTNYIVTADVKLGKRDAHRENKNRERACGMNDKYSRFVQTMSKLAVVDGHRKIGHTVHLW